MFKSLFTNEIDDPKLKLFNRVFRILAYKFLREEFLTYLYTNKKIKQVDTMLKYQKIVIRGLRDPKNFTNWKLEDNLKLTQSVNFDNESQYNFYAQWSEHDNGEERTARVD